MSAVVQDDDLTLCDADIDRLLDVEIFRSASKSRFPANLNLPEILRRHARIERYGVGDIIVREGDYGSSAFVILTGKARVVTRPSLSPGILGRRTTQKRNFFRRLFPGRSNSSSQEQGLIQNTELTVQSQSDPSDVRVKLQNIQDIISQHETVSVPEGEIFGEIAALEKSSRMATVFAETDVELVELSWQGLRLIAKYAEGFQSLLEERYRSNSLYSRLREAQLFRNFSNEDFDRLVKETELATFGEQEWQKPLISNNASQRVPVIRQGDELDALLIIRNGFVQICESNDDGSERTTGFLRRGEVFGMDTLESLQHDGRVISSYSLYALGSVDVLRIPLSLIHELLVNGAKIAIESKTKNTSADEIPTEMLDFFLNGRFVNGTAMMLVDLQRCIRCDECVKACSVAHDGNPQFVRDGPIMGSYMIASACMHCIDPLCQTGCPTGAIHKSMETGQTVINTDTCIGCYTCADSCPYGNIRMTELVNDAGVGNCNSSSGRPVMKATACDLCADLPGGPACQRACPYNALIRIDPLSTSKLTSWLKT